MGLFSEIHRRDPLLSTSGWLQVALGLVFLAALAADERELLGVNPWLKPLKFSLSIAIYLWTIAWFLGDVRPGAPGAAFVISTGTVLAMFAEIGCIALQAWRGVPSHFNVSTPLDAAVFGVMAIAILFSSLLTLLLLALYLLLPPDVPRAYVYGIRLGLILFLAGSAVGPMMVGRRSHGVGGPDGGPGLPVVNWSTEHGDLRVAHAVGLHALQVLPFVGWRFSQWGQSSTLAIALTLVVALVWASIFVWTLQQARSGRPLVTWDCGRVTRWFDAG